MSALVAPAAGTVEAEVLAGVQDMYAAFVDADRARFDSHLDAGTTTWESHLPHLFTRAELDGFRDRRTAAERPVLAELRAEPLRVEVWGDTALVAYELVAVPADGSPEGRARVTDVLRRGADGWRIVHHHAQGEVHPPVPAATATGEAS